MPRLAFGRVARSPPSCPRRWRICFGASSRGRWATRASSLRLPTTRRSILQDYRHLQCIMDIFE
eukprot:15164567-Alexandrium_andersonii.AAC.1